MKYLHITYIIVILALLSACSSDNDLSSDDVLPPFPSDNDWTEELMDGASATVKGFQPGDMVTRTSLVFNGQSLVFGWKEGDKLGLYPTAKDLSSILNSNSPQMVMKKVDGEAVQGNGGVQEGESSDNNPIMDGLLPNDKFPHPSKDPNLYRVDPAKSIESPFTCVPTTSQTTRIENGQADFVWDEVVQWSAYFQTSKTVYNKEEPKYDNRYFKFDGQKQGALTEIGEYFDYEDNVGNAQEHLSKYQWSEEQACAHLGDFDVMISPETKWTDGSRINFQMRHVGAVARIYLKVAEENLIIKDVKLICDKKIFYEKGKFTLFSHPYVNDETKNYGVDFSQQIEPVGDPVNKLQLDFETTCKTKKTGSGNYGPYVVAYLMMYPITYNPETDGNLFAYVTATDQLGKEVHYVSDPLSGKVMESGKYYQWTSSTHADDGLYPIELTATLLPWQDIVGGGINTDLEK